MREGLFSLQCKAAPVTGSTHGIGRGIAEQLCQANAACRISSEDSVEVERVSKDFGENGYEVAGKFFEVTDERALKSLVEFTVNQFGRLDILVCNAGITGRQAPSPAWTRTTIGGYST